MQPGDVYWVDFPAADGHEQEGERPAVILQDDRYAGASSLELAIPLSAKLKTVRFPATVAVRTTPANGLLRDSVALVLQIRATDRRRVRERMGELDPPDLAAIFAALDRLTGRPTPPAPAAVPPPAPAADPA